MMKGPTTRRVVGAAVKIAASVLSAGAFYALWLSAILLTAELDHSFVESIAWISAPLVTATGFTFGVMAYERLTGTGTARFLPVFAWPLAGCVAGALAVYWYGPMLIVFGMFAVGTASIALREIMLYKQGRNP